MATPLDTIANLTGSGVTEAQAKTWFTAMRAALAEMGDPLGCAMTIQNLSLAFSVGSNALTCNVKTRAGATPSAADPVSIAVRNATLATGNFNVRNITGALSFTISSGSTLGHDNALQDEIHWYVIDAAGTLELAASSRDFGDQGTVNTAAEGGAGAADSRAVMYSATARSGVAFRKIGRTLDIQSTAGQWTAVPIQVEAGTVPFIEATSFTPTITFGGQSVGVTYGGSTIGRYIKIHRLVVLWFILALTSKGSSTGVAQLRGFPYMVGPDTSNTGGGTITRWTTMNSALILMKVVPAQNSTWADLVGLTAGSSSNIPSLQSTDFTNSSIIQGSAWYLT